MIKRFETIGLTLLTVAILGLGVMRFSSPADAAVGDPPASRGNSVGVPETHESVFSMLQSTNQGPTATNYSLTVRPGTQTNLPSFQVQHGKSLSAYPWFFGTNAASLSNIVFKLELSPNGRVFTTTTPTNYTRAMSGLSNVVDKFDVPEALIGGANWYRWSVSNSSTGGTNAVILTNFFGLWRVVAAVTQ